MPLRVSSGPWDPSGLWADGRLGLGGVGYCSPEGVWRRSAAPIPWAECRGPSFIFIDLRHSAAPSGCVREPGFCGSWALSSPLGVTRFEVGGVAGNCLCMLGNVRKKEVKGYGNVSLGSEIYLKRL